MNMNYSDIISTLALIVSVCVGIANYWYTRRNFAASRYSALQVLLELEWRQIIDSTGITLPYGDAYLSVRLRNLSSNIPLTDIKVFIRIIHLNTRQRLWKKQWLDYFTDEHMSMLRPGEEHLFSKLYRISGEEAVPVSGFTTKGDFVTDFQRVSKVYTGAAGPSLTEFFVEKLPNVLQKEEVTDLEGKQAIYYRITQEGPFPLMLRVVYKPAILRARPRKIEKSYELMLSYVGPIAPEGSNRDIKRSTHLSWGLREKHARGSVSTS